MSHRIIKEVVIYVCHNNKLYKYTEKIEEVLDVQPSDYVDLTIDNDFSEVIDLTEDSESTSNSPDNPNISRSYSSIHSEYINSPAYTPGLPDSPYHVYNTPVGSPMRYSPNSPNYTP